MFIVKLRSVNFSLNEFGFDWIMARPHFVEFDRRRLGIKVE